MLSVVIQIQYCAIRRRLILSIYDKLCASTTRIKRVVINLERRTLNVQYRYSKLMRQLSSLGKSEITEEELKSLSLGAVVTAGNTPLQKSTSFPKPALGSAEFELEDSMRECHRMSSSEYLQLLQKDKNELQKMCEYMLLSRLCFYRPRSLTIANPKKIMFIRTTAEGICGIPRDYDQSYYNRTAEILYNTKELNLPENFEFTDVDTTAQIIAKFIQVKLSNSSLLGFVKPEAYTKFLSFTEDCYREKYLDRPYEFKRNDKNRMIKILKDNSLEGLLFNDRAKVIPIIKLISSSIKLLNNLDMLNVNPRTSNYPVQNLVFSLQTKLYRLAAHLRSLSPEMLDKCAVNSKDIESLLLVSYNYLNNPGEVQDNRKILYKLARTHTNLKDYVSLNL